MVIPVWFWFLLSCQQKVSFLKLSGGQSEKRPLFLKALDLAWVTRMPAGGGVWGGVPACLTAASERKQPPLLRKEHVNRALRIHFQKP